MEEPLTHFSRPHLDSNASIVDGLLFEIYDHWHDSRHDSFESDTFTECSSTSEVHWRRSSAYYDLDVDGRPVGRLHGAILQDQGTNQLMAMISGMQRRVNQMSARLVRQLKRRERRMSKLQNNCDIVTAIIQASSAKRRIDTRMRFSVEPPLGDSAFEQWKDAMKAVARLPLGIPDDFRKKVWLSLADNHIRELKIDWDMTVKFAFNERSNPDDNTLGLQIVKDLHRTGCSGFSGQDNDVERALLKRILLAYARWNKAVGYCQGFNVIAAVILDVMDRKEDDAFKVMIYLIDHVLPQSYFANNLRALSVDMAVFRDLLRIFPRLSKHLDYLQHAQDQDTGGCYEPPLTNVFTMQWFLTLFATCLPKSTVLRVWDSILLEGSEILLRTALVIWGKLSSRILTVPSADEFYTLMGDITHEMLEGNVIDADSMIKHLYTIAPLPFPQLAELREKYTYNIRPLTHTNKRTARGGVVPSDEDELDDDEMEAITCFTGFTPAISSTGRGKALDGDQRTGSVPDISSLGPGAYGLGPTDNPGIGTIPAYMERMTTDIGALKKQYAKLKLRQAQAHIILTSATAKKKVTKPKTIVPVIESPTAINHLFLVKQGLHANGKNRFVAAGPRIANMYPITAPLTSGQTQQTVQPVTPQAVGDMTCKRVQNKASASGSKHHSPGISPRKHLADDSNPSGSSCLPGTESSENPSVLVSSVSTPDTVTGATTDSKEDIVITHKMDEANMQAELHGNAKKRNDSGLGVSLSSPAHSNSSNESGTHDCSYSDIESSPIHRVHTVQCEPVAESCRHTDDSVNLADPDSGLVDDILSGETEKCVINRTQESDSSCDSKQTMAIEGANDECDGDITIDESHRPHIANDDVNGECSTVRDSISMCTEQHSSVPEVASTSHTHKEKHENTAQTSSKSSAHLDRPTDSSSSVSCCKPKVELKTNSLTLPNANNINNNSGGSRPCTLSTSAVKLSKTSAVSAGRIPRTCSSTSTESIHSRSDSESLSDVFSPDTDSHSLSFQQYYSTKRNMVAEASGSLQTHLQQTKKSFDPFPVKHVNTNRAKTGLKLGLYKPSTLEQFEKNLKKQPVWGK